MFFHCLGVIIHDDCSVKLIQKQVLAEWHTQPFSHQKINVRIDFKIIVKVMAYRKKNTTICGGSVLIKSLVEPFRHTTSEDVPFIIAKHQEVKSTTVQKSEQKTWFFPY